MVSSSKETIMSTIDDATKEQPQFTISQLPITVLMNATQALELSDLIEEQSDELEPSILAFAKNLQDRIKAQSTVNPQTRKYESTKKQDVLREVQKALEVLENDNGSPSYLNAILQRVREVVTSAVFLEMRNDNLGRFIISEFPITISFNYEQARLLAELILDQEEEVVSSVYAFAERLQGLYDNHYMATYGYRPNKKTRRRIVN